MNIEKTALEVCVEEIYEIAKQADGMSEPVFKALLKGAIIQYYRAHSIEMLEMLEAQHHVTDIMGCEGTI